MVTTFALADFAFAPVRAAELSAPAPGASLFGTGAAISPYPLAGSTSNPGGVSPAVGSGAAGVAVGAAGGLSLGGASTASEFRPAVMQCSGTAVELHQCFFRHKILFACRPLSTVNQQGTCQHVAGHLAL